MSNIKTLPKVSIGMPVYNGEQFIREALDSLLAQTFTDFELIISDNASTDGTESICREYVARDNRIRYVRQPENLGAIANFQFVLDESIGEYFMWAAADDKEEPEFIETLYNTIIKNPEFVLVMSDVIRISDEGNVLSHDIIDSIRVEVAKSTWNRLLPTFFEYPADLKSYSVYGLFKTAALKTERLYKTKPRYLTATETPLLAKVALQGRIGTIPKLLKYYRIHSKSSYHQEVHSFNTFKYIFIVLFVYRMLLLIVIYDVTLPMATKISIFFHIVYKFMRGLIKAFIRILTTGSLFVFKPPWIK